MFGALPGKIYDLSTCTPPFLPPPAASAVRPSFVDTINRESQHGPEASSMYLKGSCAGRRLSRRIRYSQALPASETLLLRIRKLGAPPGKQGLLVPSSRPGRWTEPAWSLCWGSSRLEPSAGAPTIHLLSGPDKLLGDDEGKPVAGAGKLRDCRCASRSFGVSAKHHPNRHNSGRTARRVL